MLFDNPPKEWNVTTLGEVCSQGGGGIQTGPFGSQLHASDYVDEGIPSIMPANIGDNRISEEGIARITKEDADRLSKYLVQIGDIVYSRRGDVEKCALVRKNEDGWLCGTGCLRVRPGNGVADPLFCSYFLSHPDSREWISRHAVGATMPNLNTQILSEVPFLLPDWTEQKAIAHILGTLDEKIELNRKTNETLEGIAKALFKSWFVDFDPVRAKAEGRPTGLPDEISELLPDSFENSELGEIPSGWEFKQLGSIADVIDPHPSHRAPEAIEEGYPFAGIGDIDAMGNISIHKARVVGEETIQEQEESFSINNRTIGFGRVGTVGKVVRLRNQDFRYALSPTLAVVNPQKRFASACYLLLGSTTFQNTVFSQMTGSTRPAIGIKVLRKLSSPFPSCDQPQILKSFEGLCAPLLAKGDILNSEIQLLTSLRDALLPRLISGELRVPDAEKMLEEVGV